MQGKINDWGCVISKVMQLSDHWIILQNFRDWQLTGVGTEHSVYNLIPWMM